MSGVRTLELDGWMVVDDGEPRVSAFEIAERSGMPAPRQVKELLGRNRAELEMHGPIPMRRSVRRIEKRGAIGGVEFREVETPMLNEAQALNLVALMRTARASELRVALIKVFIAVRKGEGPPPLDGATLNAARIGDDPTAARALRNGVTRVRNATGYSTQRVHGFLRKTQRVSSPFAISLHLLAHVLQALEQVEFRQVALLSGKDARLLSRATSQQLKLWEVN